MLSRWIFIPKRTARRKSKRTRPGGFVVEEILMTVWTDYLFAYFARLSTQALKLRSKVTLFYSIHPFLNFIVIASERQL